ncbi:MAG TPA: hypothetical protein ENJ61_00290 [Aquifex aeolicus]|uniref:Uncharacterized protein n=1 Tax=Aquifex aeolicus TaxID=63363 RepID=A0A7C5L1K8_AQUAO|nr:hypothetical protein [Aquifex aeolicus]
MRKLFLFLCFSFTALAQPGLVYEPPSVSKLEVYLFAGKPGGGNYHLAGGFDWRIGYPFLAGVFYEKEEGMDGVGARVKVRIPLFWRFKNDFSFGTVFERRFRERVGFLVQMEQAAFLRRSFSFRLLEGYIFGSREVRRWVIAVGFGF